MLYNFLMGGFEQLRGCKRRSNDKGDVGNMATNESWETLL